MIRKRQAAELSNRFSVCLSYTVTKILAMLEIISIMFLGIGTGYILRKKPMTNSISSIINILIWTLLFLLGIEAGSNPKIISSVSTLSIEALVITLGSVIGSCIAANLLWHRINNKKTKNSQ